MGIRRKLTARARTTSLTFLSGARIWLIFRLRPMLAMLPITKTRRDRLASVVRISVISFLLH
jgi:hypothetical protein